MLYLLMCKRPKGKGFIVLALELSFRKLDAKALEGQLTFKSCTHEQIMSPFL